jgi:hypothetical protein
MKMTCLAGIALVGLIGSSGGIAQTNVCPPRTQWDRSYGGTGWDSLEALLAMPDGGLVAAGYSDSVLGDRHSGAYGLSDAWVVRLNSSGDLLWERSFGGGLYDRAKSVAMTSDGGFIVGASSSSSFNGNKNSPNFGKTDYWLIRLDGDGNKIWDRSFGGLEEDYLQTVLQTSDGGFLLAGTSGSRPGGTKTSTNFSGLLFGYDFWVIRTDSDGNKLWEQSYGGTESEYLRSAVAAGDGGFLLAGTSYSGTNGNKTVDQIGYGDYWVVRIDGDGTVVWQASFGGESSDSLECAAKTADGGFVLGGLSYSDPGLAKTSPGFGSGDYWVVRIDAQGNPLWDAAFGGESYDSLSSIQELAGGGFVLGGSSYSFPSGNRTSVSRGRTDFWVVRLSASGEKVWEQSYGALDDDLCQSAIQTSDGGFAFGGYSYSRPRSGKSAPLLGQADFWIVRTAAETSGDCDGDGVPDASDQCPDTAFGDVVNTNGCGIKQYCPCDGQWASRSNYVACVESNTIPFVANGLISEMQRQALIAQAQNDDCPPTPRSVVACGLTNSIFGEALITAIDNGGPSVEEAGPSGSDGISIHLGQADSGVFIYPYAGGWGDYSESWFLLGTAYGRLNGQSNVPLAKMRGTKPYYETYPVDVDFTPLQPESLTFLVWSNGFLVADVTNPGPVGGITVHSASSLGHRVNPFWRAADGSVGALIEFTEVGAESIPAIISGPFGDAVGNLVFIRANAPSNTADYVSRFDIVIGGGLIGFSSADERPGVFGRPHRVLGMALIEPAIGRLQLTRMAQAYPGESYGAMAELRGDRQLNFGLEPLVLSNASAQFSFSLDGSVGLQLTSTTNVIAVNSFFNGFDGNQRLNVGVYRQGVLQGTLLATNWQPMGWIEVPDTNDWPRLIGCGGRSETNSDIAVSFSLDRVVTLVGVDGTELHGDHFRIATGTNAQTYFAAFSSAVLTAIDVPSFAITSEDATFRPPPLSIAREGAEYLVSWPSRNLPLVLESSPVLGQTFTVVDAEVRFQDGRHRVALPAAEQGSRFFRLKLAAE